MFSTIKFKKLTKALFAAGLVFAANGYAADTEQDHIIKVKTLLDDVKVMVSEGTDVHVIKLDKADLDSAELVEKLDQLPESARGKVEALLAQINEHDTDNMVVLADKVIESVGEGGLAKKVMFISGNNELELELPPEPPLPPGAVKPVKPVKVFKIALDGDDAGSHEYKLLAALLKKAQLSPEQIDELQTLLNEK